MTSNLKRFGLKHLSHSNLDLARNDLGLWVMRYLYKVYDPANAAMARGNAAEHGCYVALTGGEFDDPVDAAVKDFNKRTALGVNGEARDRERKNIPGFIEQFIEAIGEDKPEVVDYQRRIEVEIDGIDIPCMGFTDFGFEDAIVDLKTTNRMPSAISASHRRQGSIYQRAAGNRSVDFLYVSAKKWARYELTDSDQDWREVCETAHRLDRLLGKFETKEEVAEVVMPNFDTFYWSSPATREKAREIFGF
jgi:hypothetical protein|tara:strand:+ start:1466 stop:2212 length:747 start_codon:yes stop_codon:yes gene_type:complete